MKKSLNIFVVAAALMVAQACGKSEKNKEENASTETAVTAVAVTVPTLAEKRAKIEKARAEREEARKMALEERWKTTPTYTDEEGMIVYYKAEVSPSFVGGDAAMSKYLNDNIKYPEAAKAQEAEGTVFVDFIVATDGSVRNVVATDAAGEDVDQTLRDEAIRVVSSMPKWTPGRQHGKPVHVSYSLPITFQIN